MFGCKLLKVTEEKVALAQQQQKKVLTVLSGAGKNVTGKLVYEEMRLFNCAAHFTAVGGVTVVAGATGPRMPQSGASLLKSEEDTAR